MYQKNKHDILDEDDMFTLAYQGFTDAAKRYDPERGVKFKTFASKRASGAILDEMRRLDWVPRLERSRKRKAEKNGQDYNIISVDSIFGLDTEDGSVDAYANYKAEIAYKNTESSQNLEDMYTYLFGKLRKDYQRMAHMYYIEKRKMREIGKEFDLVESRICQIFNQTIYPEVYKRASSYKKLLDK